MTSRIAHALATSIKLQDIHIKCVRLSFSRCYSILLSLLFTTRHYHNTERHGNGTCNTMTSLISLFISFARLKIRFGLYLLAIILQLLIGYYSYSYYFIYSCTFPISFLYIKDLSLK